MRQVSWMQLEEYINRYSASPSIAFGNYIRNRREIHLLGRDQMLSRMKGCVRTCDSLRCHTRAGG
ncbi:hypothetical protein BDW59DRAFT_144740 [Aspergillus cavernicola]|uniref:Uncharacterized protein n=1 Tax=Aspergillus cavernicola TaxID=176166 RepID=A0ABR4IGE1_9EURO